MSYIQSAPATSKTHRFFYINGKKVFGFFTTPETDINKILEKFFQDKDFISMRDAFGEEWSNLKLVKFDQELNEIHLEKQEGKSLTKFENIQNNAMKKERTVKRQMYKREEKKKKKSLI